MRALVLLLCLALASAADAAGRVGATITPPIVTLGESAQLSITLSGGGNAGDPTVPAVDGLRIQRAGSSTNMQIVNGQVTSTVTLHFQVTPDRPGTFTIPAIIVPLSNGESLESMPVRLQVNATRGAGAPGPAPIVLALTLPRPQLWVGELSPLEVQLRARDGAQISELARPTLTGNAFTVNGRFDEAAQATTVIDGTPVTTFTWPAAVAGVKPGPQRLVASVDAIAALPGQRGPQGGDPFFDGFFGRFFGQSRLQRLHLTSEPLEVDVRPLPEEGRPPEFGGAIGRFQMTATAAPASVAVGDPVTLTITVEGSGNFDRVTAPVIPAEAGWKSYPASATFAAADATGIRGTKKFAMAIVPERGDLTATPALSLAVFDPEAGRYETLTAPSIPIAVRGGATTSPPSTVPVAATPEPRSQDDLAPNAIALGRLRRTLRPVTLDPRWWIALAFAPAVLGLTALILRRRRRLEGDVEHLRDRAAERAVREQLGAVDEALARADATALLIAARRAVQARLARRWALNADAITLAEVDVRLGADDEIAAAVRRILSAADEATYSGRAVDHASLAEWREHLVRTLAALEHRP